MKARLLLLWRAVRLGSKVARLAIVTARFAGACPYRPPVAPAVRVPRVAGFYVDDGLGHQVAPDPWRGARFRTLETAATYLASLRIVRESGEIKTSLDTPDAGD
jgi:hypothetical protein